MTEKRRHARLHADNHTYVFWTDAQGRYWQEKVPVNDISPSGLSVALKNRIEPRTQIGIRSTVGSVTISARVRHVRQNGMRFLAGLELPTPESHSRG